MALAPTLTRVEKKLLAAVKLMLPATVKLPDVLTTCELSLAFARVPDVMLVALAANVVALVYAVAALPVIWL